MFAAGTAGALNLSIRPKNLIVSPSTGPVWEIVVRNNDSVPWKGSLTPGVMPEWKISPLKHEVELKAGELKALPFAIESGSDLAANRYPVIVTAYSGSQKTELRTEVVCASTPYYQVRIDGSLDEWNDAIPIRFMTKGKSTVVRSYWNKNQFFLAVEVEEDQLIGIADASKEKGLVAAGQSTDSSTLPLEKLTLDEAEIRVARSGSITTYEIAVPMKPMKNLLVTAGREYCFNLLAHDPDSTGVRDLGSVMNLWEDQRKKESWSNWEFARWNGYVPFDIGIEFGFCSSIH